MVVFFSTKYGDQKIEMEIFKPFLKKIKN